MFSSQYRNISFWIAFVLLCCYATPEESKAATASSASDEVVAEVEGEKITSEQLDKSLINELRPLQEQIHNLKQQKLDQMINERLLNSEATRRKMSAAELLDLEVTKKVTSSGASAANAPEANNTERSEKAIRLHMPNLYPFRFD